MKAFVCDVEGTLIDCTPQILASWRETLQRFGFSVSDSDLQRYSGLDGADMLRRVLPPDTPAKRRQEIAEAQAEYYRKKFLPKAAPFPAVRELLQAIKASELPIGIATTCRRDELD